MNKEKLKTQLSMFIGTEHYYPLPPFNLLITDGIKFLGDNADCWWLILEIAGFQAHPQVAKLKIQFWELVSCSEHGATLTCYYDIDQPVLKANVPITDFPFDIIPNCHIWVEPEYYGDKVVPIVYLPSEH